MLFRKAWKSLHDYRDELDKREAAVFEREIAVRQRELLDGLKRPKPPAG